VPRLQLQVLPLPEVSSAELLPPQLQVAPATGTATASGDLFGNKPATTTAATPSLFGNTQPATATTTTAAPTSLFGSAQPAAAAPSTGLFGAAQNTNATNTVPAATIDISRLTPTTRFGDCHQSIQNELQQIETEIQSQITLSASLADRFPAHRSALKTIPADASVLSHRLATTKLFQASDNAHIAQIRALHDADDAASTLSIRTLDLFRLPHAQRSQYIARTTTDRDAAADVTSNKPMLKYFSEQADAMEKKLDVVVRSVREVEESLRSVEVQAAQGAQGAGVMGRDLTAVTGGVSGRQDARRLNRTLREFNEALKDVSGRILDTRDALAAIEGR
jgi:nucleoporin p58/p45